MESNNELNVKEFKRIQSGLLNINTKNHIIYKGVNTIGRNKIAVVNINNLKVSQNHALIIILDNENHFISDMNSSNGTFIENNKLVPFNLFKLTDGMVIKFGDVSTTYHQRKENECFKGSEMSQDMTQNFYNANTQLINCNDNTDNTTKSTKLSIFEQETQVISNLPQNEEKAPIIATNEVTINDRLSNSKASSESSQNSVYNKELHEAPTQILTLPEEKAQISSSINKVSLNNELQTQENGLEEKEASTINMQMPAPKKNVIHTSQSPSTSKTLQLEESYESSKELTVSSIVIDETLLEDTHSNDSMDFLNNVSSQSFAIQVENNKNEEEPIKESMPQDSIDFLNNMESQTNTKQDGLMKDSVPYDSDSEIEDIGLKRKSVKPLSTQYLESQKSDSETDLEDDIIGYKKKVVKPLLSQDAGSAHGESDIETDIEDDDKPKPDLDDTDCIPATQDAYLHKPAKSQVECSEDSFKLGLTQLMDGSQNSEPKIDSIKDNHVDELYLMPTQKVIEPCPAKFNFKKNVNLEVSLSDFSLGNASVSDEDGFKILDGQESENLPKENQNKGTDDLFMNYLMPTQKITEPNSNVNQNEENQSQKNDDFYLMSTQKITEPDTMSHNCEEAHNKTNVDQNKELSNNNKTEKNDEATIKTNNDQKEESLYENETKENDDFYLIPTQKIIELDTTTSHNCEKHKVDHNEESSYENQTQKNDDFYLVPTQKITESSENFIFKKPFELKTTSSFLPSDEISDNENTDDLYLMPTQKITEPSPNKLNVINDVSLNAFCSTTEENCKEVINNNHDKSDFILKDHDYLMPTQKIVELQPKETNIDKKSEDKVTSEEDTQVEMPFISPTTHFKVDETPTNRPANPIIQEFEMNEESNAETNRQKETIIKKPLPPKPNKSKEDPSETLSQIEAFVKKPLSPKLTKSIEVKDTGLDEIKVTVTSYRSSMNLTNKLIDLDESSTKTTKKSAPKDTCSKESSSRRTTRIESKNTSDDAVDQTFAKKPLKKQKNPEDALSSTKRTLRRRNNSSKEAAAISSIDDDGPIVHEALKEIKERNEDGTLKADASINNQVNYDQPTSKRESERRIKSNKVVSTATSSSKNTQSVAQEKIEDNNKDGPLKGDIPVSNEINHDQPSSKRESKKRIKSNKDAATTSSIDNDQPFVQKPSTEIENKNEDGTFEGDIPINNDQPTIKESRIRIKNNKDAARTNSIDNNQTVAQKSEIKDNNENATVHNDHPLSKRTSNRQINSKGDIDKIGSNKEDSTVGNDLPSLKRTSRRRITSVDQEVFVDKLAENNRPSSSKKLSNVNEDDTSTEKKSAGNDQLLGKRTSRRIIKSVDDDAGDKFIENTPLSNKRTSKRQIKINVNTNSSDDQETFILNASSKGTEKDVGIENESLKDNDVGNEQALIKRTANKRNAVNKINNEDTGVKRTRKASTCNETSPTHNNSEKPTSSRTRISRKRTISSSSENEFTTIKPIKENSDFSTPKKLKNASSNETLLSPAERSKRKQRPKVVFTMLDSPQLESYIKHLGGSVVDSVEACTVLVTQSVKRSQKLLAAVAQGIPICTPNWIQESKKSNEFLDPWDYLLIDKEAEAKWEFSLKESLNRATNKKLFDGYTFQLIVSTAVDVLKGSIKAAGGKIVAKQSKNLDLDKFIVVSSADQKSKYQKMLKQQPHIKIIEPEGIFDGILRQEFRIHRHILK